MGDERSTTPAPLVFAAAAASATAGLVHAAAAGTHTGEDSLVRLFAACAIAQLALAMWTALRASRTALALTALVNLAAAVAWALSRTRGLPLIDALRAKEEVGTQDLAAAALGAAAAVTAGLALVRPRLRAFTTGRPSVATVLASCAVLALGTAGVVSPHVHGASHDHAHADTQLAADGHTHAAADGTTAADVTTLAATDGPITSLDDARVTTAQRAAARSLIDTTATGLAGFTDVASVEAAGYRSIGDGVTGFEHFVSWVNLIDGVDLDPAKVESLVFAVPPTGAKRLVSAMYILSPGKTMADVPDIAGALTTWHDHQDLCWQGTHVVARATDGVCPRGVLAATPPMLHVWLVDTPCGPFAGLEGHGTSGCQHTH